MTFCNSVVCTGSTLGCHLLWKRANPSVLILQHSSLAPICFFTGSIYSSPCQNKTLPLRPCSSLKYSLAWKEVYIKATVKGVKTNHKDVFLFLNGKYASVIFHKNYQYHDSLFKIEYGAFHEFIIHIREDINEKKTLSFGHCPNPLNPPPPDPNLGNLVLFFRTSKFKI